MNLVMIVVVPLLWAAITDVDPAVAAQGSVSSDAVVNGEFYLLDFRLFRIEFSVADNAKAQAISGLKQFVLKDNTWGNPAKLT